MPTKEHHSCIPKPIVVYQMGHVASQSLYEALKSNPISKVPVVHTHWLSDSSVESFKNAIERNYKAGNLALAEKNKEKLIRLQEKRTLILSGKAPVKLVVPVREPIGRAISTIFYELGRDKPLEYWEQFKELNERHLRFFYETLRDIENLYVIYKQPREWFDKELRQVFGIDVFDYPFDDEDRNHGYKIIYKGNIVVLLIRVEDLNKCFRSAFQEFLDISIERLPSRNNAETKVYASAYSEFKRKASIPSDIIDLYYSLRYAIHFYSHNEIVKYRQRWTEPKFSFLKRLKQIINFRKDA